MLLTDFLTKERIKIPLEVDNRDSAIQELIEHVSSKIQNPQKAYRAVLDREKIMTTGIGNGIAIPHCKDDGCPEFVTALGISKTGIDFKAIDNIDVKIIFLVVGPADEPHKHIKLLSRISRIMSNEDIRLNLMEAKNADQAYQMIEAEEKNHPVV